MTLLLSQLIHHFVSNDMHNFEARDFMGRALGVVTMVLCVCGYFSEVVMNLHGSHTQKVFFNFSGFQRQWGKQANNFWRTGTNLWIKGFFFEKLKTFSVVCTRHQKWRAFIRKFVRLHCVCTRSRQSSCDFQLCSVWHCVSSKYLISGVSVTQDS